MQSDLGTMCHINCKEVTSMKVNPKTIKIILDIVAALAMAASGVIVKDFLSEEPVRIDPPQD